MRMATHRYETTRQGERRLTLLAREVAAAYRDAAHDKDRQAQLRKVGRACRIVQKVAAAVAPPTMKSAPTAMTPIEVRARSRRKPCSGALAVTSNSAGIIGRM